MNDDAVNDKVQDIEKAELARERREYMSGEHTFEVNGQAVTMSEHDWFELMATVSTGCKWATQVMVWHDMEQLLTNYVGFDDQTYIDLPTPEARKAELFDKGIAPLDAWRNPGDTWRVTQLGGAVLKEMGYFDSPIEMIQWTLRAEGADTKGVGEAAGMLQEVLGGEGGLPGGLGVIVMGGGGDDDEGPCPCPTCRARRARAEAEGVNDEEGRTES